MKKICIICPWNYPVPAVSGGAVETLVQFLVEENEDEQLFEFALLTTYDKEAEKLAGQYLHTKYVGFKKSPCIDKIWEFCFRALKKVFHIYIPPVPRIVGVLNYLKRNRQHFDYILLESNSYMLPSLARIFPREKIILHLHWPGDGNHTLDNSTGNVITVSNYIAREWQKKTDCPDDKLHVLYNCCNDKTFTKTLSPDEILQMKGQLGIKDEKVILFIGRILEKKGILDLIKAFQNAKLKNVILPAIVSICV